jgi:hypothetical protein
MKATYQQLTKIHMLLTQLQLLDEKKNLVMQFTNRRATSSKDMTKAEAAALIGALSQDSQRDEYNPCDRMRRKVFALAYEAGFIYGDTPEDKSMNSAKLNAWIMEKGTVKKTLNKMSKAELIKTINQFEQIVKHTAQTGANKETRSLLNELGITTTKKADKGPLNTIK